LTTGFYIGLLGCGGAPPRGRCYHGNRIWGWTLCDGLYKDKPERTFHELARLKAYDATVDYLGQILYETAVAQSDEAKKCLVGLACAPALSPGPSSRLN
jgi:hypothetical protein